MKIISGGQTGVDRAALDAAIACKLPCGGWCPAGRKAEDGEVPRSYPLKETADPSYRQRTEWNVRDGDATLIIVRKVPLTGGTSFTADLVKSRSKPCLIVNLKESDSLEKARAWLAEIKPKVLNVAGPRESYEPGIYEEAKEFLVNLFSN